MITETCLAVIAASGFAFLILYCVKSKADMMVMDELIKSAYRISGDLRELRIEIQLISIEYRRSHAPKNRIREMDELQHVEYSPAECGREK